MRHLLLLPVLYLFSIHTLAQTPGPIERVEPPNWWVGMHSEDLQLLVKGPQIALHRVTMRYPGVRLQSVATVDNPNYLLLNIKIAPSTKAGLVPILFQNGDRRFTVQYELKAREGFENRIMGISSEDFIYLLMPDRFANGNPQNDAIAGMNQPESSRTEQYGRHGGDLQGVIDHLDYFEALGVTALWLNPVLENNQPHESYHGYAATDHYKIDPRLGSNEIYRTLVHSAHSKGIKIIWDVIHNHVGDEHWLIKDLPASDWLNQWPEFTKTTYRAPTLLDPYASEYDRKLMASGWFDTHMPDLNQRNPFVANYLIQNNIWWIEYAGIDGFRIDTYAYPDQDFMAAWAKRMRAEYPQLGLFAETWVHGVPVQAFFTEKNGWASDNHMPGVTDFQLYYAINDALTKDFGWTDGLARIYYTLAKDLVYHDPMQNVVFLDNHDLERFFSVVNEDLDSYKMGLGFLLTTRGIPQMYYGTEILMKNHFDWNNHDKVREEFPGGWAGDAQNKFVPEGRTATEQEAFSFVQKLAQFRKSSSAIKSGSLMQFVPEEGVYVYFRYDAQQTIMVIMNQNKEEKILNMGRFAERTQGFGQAMDVLSAQAAPLDSQMKVDGRSIQILELKP